MYLPSFFLPSFLPPFLSFFLLPSFLPSFPPFHPYRERINPRQNPTLADETNFYKIHTRKAGLAEESERQEQWK